MVGGDDYRTEPFNLATQGQRQPGSAFKPFIARPGAATGHLAQLDLGFAQADLCITPGKKAPAERSTVNNYNDAYAGITRSRARRRSPTTPCSRTSASRSGRRRSPRSPGGWASARRSRTTRDDAGRPPARRHPARHGARVRDVREQRQADVRHAQPRPRRPAAPPGPRPGRAEGDRPGRGRQAPADRAAERRQGAEPAARAARDLPRRRGAGRLAARGRRR